MTGQEFNGNPSGAAGGSRTGHHGQPMDHHRRSDYDRTAAKTGMALAMGALLVTGMMDGRTAGKLHIVSGIALMGFSFWHHHLYHGSPRGRKA